MWNLPFTGRNFPWQSEILDQNRGHLGPDGSAMALAANPLYQPLTWHGLDFTCNFPQTVLDWKSDIYPKVLTLFWPSVDSQYRNSILVNNLEWTLVNIVCVYNSNSDQLSDWKSRGFCDWKLEFYHTTVPKLPRGSEKKHWPHFDNPPMKLEFKDVWYSKAQEMLKFTFNALIQQQ